MYPLNIPIMNALSEITTQPYVWFMLSGLAAIVAAFKFQTLYPHLFNKGKHECEQKLLRLCAVTSVVIKLIQPDYENNPPLKEALEDLNGLIVELEKETNN